ncbi:DUF2694 family protein [Williamsia herbipolensis]|uniref:DUF2694 family protein n=1 Tax=Williamsia herbipolensis TaxID=1603258 RepID=UPI000696C8B7|nr:DUF2694 family protein [Williamsia herbipolensis]
MTGYRDHDPYVYEEYDEYDRDAADEIDQAQAEDEATATSTEHSLPTVGLAATPSGSIEVRTTEQGLPTSIRIERSEMDKPADTLARTILLLCQQAGKRAAAAHRAQLLADGHPLEAVSYLNLPTDRDAADFDLYVDSQLGDSEPDTWMRRV